eukprot:5238544-Pleurochrysis_carterae.AAC.1
METRVRYGQDHDHEAREESALKSLKTQLMQLSGKETLEKSEMAKMYETNPKVGPEERPTSRLEGEKQNQGVQGPCFSLGTPKRD